eukprot:SM000002S05515  [mRNA]  locus=s2:287692:290861:- [translate_table: standard]
MGRQPRRGRRGEAAGSQAPCAALASGTQELRRSSSLLSALFGGGIGGGGGSGRRGGGGRHRRAPPDEVLPEYLHERLLAFAIESDAEHVGEQEDDRRYVRCLKDVAAFLAQHHPDTVLLVNLGALLLRPELYALFGNNVCEFGAAWDQPRGAGVCPLDTLFAACASINNWLALDDEHVAVLHTRSPADGNAATFLRFVTACYLAFCSEFDHALEALESLPRALDDEPPRFATGGPSPLRKQAAVAPAGKGAAATATAAQRRYCQYFGDILYSPAASQRRKGAVTLQKVILGSCPSIDGADGCRPYIKVAHQMQGFYM